MKCLSILFFVLLLFSCGNNNNSERNRTSETLANSNLEPVSSRLDLENTDSIEVYFYADPEKQNEFKRLYVKDRSSIDALVKNLDSHPDSLKECPHDGKIYFYRNGEVFKTIYLATADTCRYLAYVINANRYFVSMNDSSVKLIDMFKSSAH